MVEKDTPHSLLLFSTTLNHKTSPSGHTGRPQNMESMTILEIKTTVAANNPIFNPLENNNLIAYDHKHKPS